MIRMLFLFSFVPALVWAQAPLSLEDALTLSAKNADLQAVFASRLAQAEADLMAQRVFANPEFNASYAAVDEGDNRVRESSYTVSQRLLRPDLRRSQVQHSESLLQVAEQQNQVQLLDHQQHIKSLFFDTLYLQEHQALLADWQAYLDALYQRQAEYKAEGLVSGYALRLLGLELREAERLVRQNAVQLQQRQTELFALLQLDEPRPLSGSLLPTARAETTLADHPRLRVLAGEERAAELLVAANQKWLLPEFTVEAGIVGFKDDFTQDTGVMLGFSLPLPIFQRNQAQLHRAKAQASQARSELGLAKLQLNSRLQALQAAIAQVREDRDTYANGTLVDAQTLVEIAALGFKEGEFSATDYMAAQQALRDAKYALLDLDKQLRELTLELEYLRGAP